MKPLKLNKNQYAEYLYKKYDVRNTENFKQTFWDSGHTIYEYELPNSDLLVLDYPYRSQYVYLKKIKRPIRRFIKKIKANTRRILVNVHLPR